MTYERIRPFPDPQDFLSPELRALTVVWREKKATLENDGAYQEFVKKLHREWAIETGIIERLYTWDRGVTEVLIEKGIEASIISHHGGLTQKDAEHFRTLINDHLGIIEGLFSFIKGDEPISEYFIRGLQAQFTAHQDDTEAVTESGDLVRVKLVKGDYKTLPNNPRRPDGEMHTYCPPELTKEEMENLVRMYREAEVHYSPEVKAAWLHHRFVQIHPFQDGNGRVARALASLVFLREGLFPLVVRESDREKYIGALESADAGDLSHLVAFFAQRQRDAILKALGLEQQVQQGRQADEIISSALEALKGRYDRKSRVATVYRSADGLLSLAEVRLSTLAQDLGAQIHPLAPSPRLQYSAQPESEGNDGPRRRYFHGQILGVARHFGYVPTFEPHRSWARVAIVTDQEFDYVVSFHGYGPSENGILAASAFTFIKAPPEDGGGAEPVDLHPAADDLFQFNYAEPYESIEQRFKEWLETSILIALAEWRRSLHG